MCRRSQYPLLSSVPFLASNSRACSNRRSQKTLKPLLPPATNTLLLGSNVAVWLKRATLRLPVTVQVPVAATLLPNGIALVVGGLDNNDDALASAELYDPASATWAATASLISARDLHTATLLPNGKVLVAGGFDSNFDALASAELYH